MTVESLGSNSTRSTVRPGMLRVMSVNVTPFGAPTVAARAFVETSTVGPSPTTTLLPLLGATCTMAVMKDSETEVSARQLLPASVVCHRFWLLVT